MKFVFCFAYIKQCSNFRIRCYSFLSLGVVLYFAKWGLERNYHFSHAQSMMQLKRKERAPWDLLVRMKSLDSWKYILQSLRRYLQLIALRPLRRSQNHRALWINAIQWRIWSWPIPQYQQSRTCPTLCLKSSISKYAEEWIGCLSSARPEWYLHSM